MTNPKLDSEMVEAMARAIWQYADRKVDGLEGCTENELAQAALSVIQPRIEKLERERERMRDHLREQITFAESRIQDGIEMGATVWRIALEDIVSENLAALQSEAGD